MQKQVWEQLVFHYESQSTIEPHFRRLVKDILEHIPQADSLW